MSKDLNCKWHFASITGGEDQGPNDAMGENFKKNPYDALVRESLQNSLDAAQKNGQPVVMSYKFKHLESSDYPELFAIRDHIAGCLEQYNDTAAHKKFDPMLQYLDHVNGYQVDYLEVSDENTTGMDYNPEDTNSAFYSFVKSAGKSSKNSVSAGGSFGFGKAAYFNISKLRTLLISSMTESGQYAFSGKASLCTHKYRGQKCVPAGYYCEAATEAPIAASNHIPGLFRRNTPGTSVYIMGLGLGKEETKEAARAIVESVVKHFWLAILRGKLVVKIGLDNRVQTIDSEGVEALAGRLFEKFDDTRRGHKNPRPYIDAVAHAGEDENHIVIRKEFGTLGEVEYYMLRSKNGNDYILNMRSPLMLVNHELNGTKYGFYSVFVCTDERDGMGNELLRMAENVAHNEWDDKNATEQDRHAVWQALEDRKAFIQECIATQFTPDENTPLTFGGLDEFLSIPTSLRDEEYNPNFGKPTNEESETETASTTTKLDTPEIHQPKMPPLGEVQIRKPKQQKTEQQDADFQPTGHTPEVPPVQPKPEQTEPQEPENDEMPQDNPNEEPTPRTPETNDGPNLPMDAGDGELFTPHEPLRVSYRAFAQVDETGVKHHLIIHSNRASNKVVIGVVCGGETSDEALPILQTSNGYMLDNQITRVSLTEGRNEIIIRFDDNMRHAIKLSIYEDQ